MVDIHRAGSASLQDEAWTMFTNKPANHGCRYGNRKNPGFNGVGVLVGSKPIDPIDRLSLVFTGQFVAHQFAYPSPDFVDHGLGALDVQRGDLVDDTRGEVNTLPANLYVPWVGKLIVDGNRVATVCTMTSAAEWTTGLWFKWRLQRRQTRRFLHRCYSELMITDVRFPVQRQPRRRFRSWHACSFRNGLTAARDRVLRRTYPTGRERDPCHSCGWRW